MVTLYFAEGVLTGMTGTVLLSYREKKAIRDQFSVSRFFSCQLLAAASRSTRPATENGQLQTAQA